MPKHTYWLTYLLDKLPALKANAHNLGTSIIGGEEPTYRSTEPVLTSLLYMVILTVIALVVRGRITRATSTSAGARDAVIPSDKLDTTTFLEILIGYFYDLAKDVMGAKNAKRYFPLIGGSAMFILFSNLIGLIPGIGSPTSSLNVTLGCAIVVFVTFNYYGIQENGLGYFKHMMGPMLILAPLIFLIEIVSTCVRPITLAVRLMVNIAVDHLLGALFLGLVALFVPIPFVLLGILVCVVQTLVFCLLTTVYIGLATEHQEHEAHGEAHAAH